MHSVTSTMTQSFIHVYFSESQCKLILHYNPSHYLTWNEARNNCSQCNAGLLDFRDVQCLNNISGDGIWIGLQKTASNSTHIREGNVDDLFKTRKCEYQDFNGYKKHVSCAKTLLPSFCKKGNVQHYFL